MIMKIYWVCFAGTIGACLASATACWDLRSLKNESWIRGKSHCDYCEHELNGIDLVPILGYILLHGRCRYCAHKIDFKMVACEIYCAILLGCGLALTNNFWYIGMLGILCVCGVCDINTRSIPIQFSVLGVVLGIAYATSRYSIAGFWINYVVGAAMLLFCLSLNAGKKSGIGWGDILAFVSLAMVFGVYVSVLMAVSTVPAIVYFVICKFTKRGVAFENEGLALLPFIGIGTLVTIPIIQSGWVGLFCYH